MNKMAVRRKLRAISLTLMGHQPIKVIAEPRE
jgi:hypothetical protein